MTETKIELSGSCRFTLTTYENIGHKDVCLDYTEHSTDHWNSDTETSIDIDANKAREIVAFMHKAFPEIEQPAQRKPLTDEEIGQRVVIISGPEIYLGKTGVIGKVYSKGEGMVKPGHILVELDHKAGSVILPKLAILAVDSPHINIQ